MKTLIIGLGGIGQRHTRNLRALLGDSVEIIAYRTRRLSHVVTPTMGADNERNVEEVYNIRSFDSLDQALAQKPDAAFICNPSSLHVAVARACLQAGCDVFIEDQQPVKPVTYSVVKTALVGLTRYLATYWAAQHIRVNAISPGGVFAGQPDEFTTRLNQLIPLGRMAEKDEYQGAILFLCSDANSYMTGQNLIVDGGRSVL